MDLVIDYKVDQSRILKKGRHRFKTGNHEFTLARYRDRCKPKGCSDTFVVAIVYHPINEGKICGFEFPDSLWISGENYILRS